MATAETEHEPQGIALHEEEIVDLFARATAARDLPDLGFDDPAAGDLIEALDLAPRFEGTRLRTALTLTMVIDAVVRDFFVRNPDGLAIGVNPGLCTRFSRVDNGRLRWLDIDPPAIVAFKRSLLQSDDRHALGGCCSVRCAGWLSCLREAATVPTIIVAQGSLRRSSHEDLDRFLVRAAECAGTGTELVLDYDARSAIRHSSLHRGNACLESPSPEGSVVRYPRIRSIANDDHPQQLAWTLSGLNGVSRLFRGRGAASVAHLRFT
jgi:O-methyltransferase involved in polyketide biosynthesis